MIMSCADYKFPTKKDADAKSVSAGAKFRSIASFDQGIGDYNKKK
jgi:flagellum-specific peptidoglycan hydrolase FlgJ